MGELLSLTTKILTLNRVFWASVLFMQTAGDRSFTLTPTAHFLVDFSHVPHIVSGLGFRHCFENAGGRSLFGHFPLPSTILSISGSRNCRACLLFSLSLKHRRACTFRQKVRKLAASPIWRHF